MPNNQFSLAIAHTITVYKSQGIIVNQAILNLSIAEFAINLNYVALL